jgi:hypothetical protein
MIKEFKLYNRKYLLNTDINRGIEEKIKNIQTINNKMAEVFPYQ